MSTLTELVARLTAVAPPVGGKPTSAQYEQAVREAGADFGFPRPRIAPAPLAPFAGTAAHALPHRLPRLIGLAAPDHRTRDADGFLVAFDTAAGPATRHPIPGSPLTFSPAPAYTGTLGLWYAAGYPYDDADDIFTGLTGQAEDVVMLRAQANALRVLASATAAGRGLNYRIGDVSIQRPTAQPHSQLAGEMDAAYADACRAMTGFIGARASYSGWERLQ